MEHWTQYASRTLKKAIQEGKVGQNAPAEVITAAIAYLTNLKGSHPSYENSAFVIVAYFLPEALQSAAWQLVVNGLSGYFQWETHNGGKFSVKNALIHLEILTKEEATNVAQFNRYCTHEGCKYYTFKPEFLQRIVERFHLPTTRKDIGGKFELTEAEGNLRKAFKENGPVNVASAGFERVSSAIYSM